MDYGTLGYSFLPSTRKKLNDGANRTGATTQQALQTLSLRLPNVTGGAPVVPEAGASEGPSQMLRGILGTQNVAAPAAPNLMQQPPAASPQSAPLPMAGVPGAATPTSFGDTGMANLLNTLFNR